MRVLSPDMSASYRHAESLPYVWQKKGLLLAIVKPHLGRALRDFRLLVILLLLDPFNPNPLRRPTYEQEG